MSGLAGGRHSWLLALWACQCDRAQPVGSQGLCPSRFHQGLWYLGWEGLSDGDLIEPGSEGGGRPPGLLYLASSPFCLGNPTYTQDQNATAHSQLFFR